MRPVSSLRRLVDATSEDSNRLDIDLESSFGKEKMNRDLHPNFNEERIQRVFREESRISFAILLLGAICLFTTGILISFLTSFAFDQMETSDFNTVVKIHDSALLLAIRTDLQTKLNALDSFANQIAFDVAQQAALVQEEESSPSSMWPFVSIPDLESKFDKLRQLASVDQLYFLPLVEAEDVAEWNSFVRQQLPLVEFNEEDQDGSLRMDLFLGDNRIALPLWQAAPPIPNPSSYNTDLLVQPSFSRSLTAVLESNLGVFEAFTSAADIQSVLADARPGMEQNDESPSNEKVGMLVYPIFDTIHYEDDAASDVTQTPAGVLVASFFWKTLLEEAVRSIAMVSATVVLQDACGEAFQYEVESSSLDNSQQITVVGPLAVQQKTLLALQVEDNDSSAAAPLASSPLLYDNYCSFSMQLFPSENFEDEFMTHYPRVYAISVAVIFAVLIVCFGLLHLASSRRRAHTNRRLLSHFSSATLFGGTNAKHTAMSKIPSSLGGTAEVSGDDDVIENFIADDLQDRLAVDASSVSSVAPREPPRFILQKLLGSNASGSLTSSIFQRHEHRLPRQTSLGSTKAIADFFPNCTVLICDIAGFSAWSSQREPAQVFALLQTLFEAFDRRAKKLDVFKIETIGDSYVAVTGLPKPQPDHALTMAKFAVSCRSKMREIMNELVGTMGPDTVDLRMRFGMDSGPVTAGFLNVERPRFQLFGDTVVTAAHMEATGEPDRIQCSRATAALLVQAGEQQSLIQRDEKVAVKGKGPMRTFWLADPRQVREAAQRTHNPHRSSSVVYAGPFASRQPLPKSGADSDDEAAGEGHTDPPAPPNILFSTPSFRWASSGEFSASDMEASAPENLGRQSSLIWGPSQELPNALLSATNQTNRLIGWNVRLLLQMLKKLKVHRKTQQILIQPVAREMETVSLRDIPAGESVVTEVAEIIPMPDFDPSVELPSDLDMAAVNLDSDVEDQLHLYVQEVASRYRTNPFHSYEHACHVQMSMMKLLERVVTPEEIDYQADVGVVASDTHNYTFGIASDPLTQFTVVFCALIHDMDHTGVSNGQLMKENEPLATAYKNKSVAEQNSIDLAWAMLMEERFQKLRNEIYANESEFRRFRQLVVNVVLATDIFEKDLSALRKNRWNKAFSEDVAEHGDSPKDHANRKATIVIEHLIQASDVAHTMQHWEIYKRWNEKLFREMYAAFKAGRMEKDPSEFWYEGEIKFFDNYVIPLAKKLQDCEVFGVCSEECLTYAEENRRLWKLHGECLVESLLTKESKNCCDSEVEANARKVPRRSRRRGDENGSAATPQQRVGGAKLSEENGSTSETRFRQPPTPKKHRKFDDLIDCSEEFGRAVFERNRGPSVV